jgi:hypothetical protein
MEGGMRCMDNEVLLSDVPLFHTYKITECVSCVTACWCAKVPQQCQLARYEGNKDAHYVAHRDAMENNLSGFLSSGLLGW